MSKYETAATLAQDSHALPSTLEHLARHYGELRPAVALNPATADYTLEWLESLGDRDVVAALAERQRRHNLPTSINLAAGARPAGTPGTPGAKTNLSWDRTARRFAKASACVAGLFLVGGVAWQLTSPPGDFSAASIPTGSAAELTTVAPPAAAPTSAEPAAGTGTAPAASAPASNTAAPAVTSKEGALAAETSIAAPASPARSAATGPATSPTSVDNASKRTETSTDSNRAVPNGAYSVPNFWGADSNIGCSFTNNSVACTVNEKTAEFKTACNADQATTFTLFANGSLQESCHAKLPLPAAGKLLPGASATNKAFACQASTDGLDCWSVASQHGLTIKPSSWRHY